MKTCGIQPGIFAQRPEFRTNKMPPGGQQWERYDEQNNRNGKLPGGTRVTNDWLSERMDTSDEWIRTRTGIRERRLVKEETTTDMAYEAAGGPWSRRLSHRRIWS